MIAVSIMIEGQAGLTWPRWKRIVAAVEELGFAGLFRSDHFTDREPPDQDSLEMLISLAYLAGQTTRIHFGPLVAPVSFRDPVLLARQAAALDDLSGGRLILGVGAGWQDREHTMFGYTLGDISTRFARLEEGLEVITRLLRSETSVTYEGRFYHLREATLLPRPARSGGPAILIGGNGPRRTLPLAARYADWWNGTFLSPAEFQARSAQLDTLLDAAGRSRTAVRRTMMTTLIWGQEAPGRDNVVAGGPDQVRAQIAAYNTAGVEELMLQWFALDDLDGLRSFARAVAGM